MTEIASYAVDLLYDVAPELSKAEMLAKLRDRCGAVSAVDPSSEDGLNFYFPAYRVPFKEDAMPVQVAFDVQELSLDDVSVRRAIAQTWDWREAQTIVSDHAAHVSLRDILAMQLEYRARLGLFQNVLLGAMEIAMPIAIHWRASGKFVDPVKLTRALRAGESKDALFGAVNVRRFKSADRPGRMLMDTLGLSALGLTDLEVAFEGLDPGRMEAVLLSLARYEYDLGDVIADGRVVRVPGDEAAWVCQRGQSRQAPPREVIVLRRAGSDTSKRAKPL